MVKLDQLYETLGITPLQADVLIALMEKGGSASVPDIISTLSGNQKVNRTSIYSILKKLENLNLVIASENTDSRNITYSLISNSPQDLVNKLTEQQKFAITDLTEKLQEAKIVASKSTIDTEFYSLKNLNQIKAQLQAVINESNEYLLIMANSLILKTLYPTIQQKLKLVPDIIILIQPTWNPDPNLDFDKLLDDFKELLGEDRVSSQLKIFSNIVEFSTPMFMEFAKTAKKESPNMLGIINTTNFIQVLTEKGMIITTYFDHDSLLSQAGTGIYSKEQFISQNFIIVYFSIFEAHHKEFNKNLMERVIKKRMNNWFTTIQAILK